jgi:hypothetical protein
MPVDDTTPSDEDDARVAGTPARRREMQVAPLAGMVDQLREMQQAPLAGLTEQIREMPQSSMMLSASAAPALIQGSRQRRTLPPSWPSSMQEFC